jgi:glycosyltransferase involved in cell wall biosynthesis
VKHVVIYRTELLPASETFIAAQSVALKKYSPWFAGLKRLPDGLPLDPGNVLSLTKENLLRDKLRRRFYLRTGLAPGFHRSLRDLRPALIHAHFAIDAGVALTLQKELRIPLVVTLHGYDVTKSDDALRQTLLGRIYLERKNAILHQTSLFLCVSDHIRGQAIERGFPMEKLSVLRIGIELPEHDGIVEREPIILFVGRMVEKKGCIHLLRAMERVEAILPALRLVLLGDGPLRAELERFAFTHLRNVTFLGMRLPCEVRQWMRRAQVLAAPGIVSGDGDSEGLPIVLCEAQAMGLPSVSCYGPGVNEAVMENQTALLVPQRDEQALSKAILRLMTEPALHRELAKAGRQRAASLFDIQKQTALLEDRYDEVVSRFAWSRK